MKWFKRKKSRTFEPIEVPPGNRSLAPHGTLPVSAQLLAKLPGPLLERIFSFVCPHTQDEAYESCEQSALEVGDTCMLCDLRDLAHCAQVSRKWRVHATKLLYHSIRIDAVHYCDLEDVLAERRKRRSHFNRNAEPEDTAQARLKLLSRTLGEDQGGFALKVQFLKTPYMTRETCKPDLARTVHVTPNLRYVDLPEGLFTDDPSCNTLKQEVQRRCPDLRKMCYMGGAERSLEMLMNGNIWTNLEVLELSKLNMDPTILRSVLGSLPHLRALKITDMKAFDDDLFRPSERLPPWPPLTELIFENTPNLTAEGLVAYLFRSDIQESLTTLSLTTTGVDPSTLHQILAVAPSLHHLSITESVSTSFPANRNVQPLNSASLKIFHYEITSVTSANTYASVIASYYDYLRSSLLSGGLPRLNELYVRDSDFADSLIDLTLPPPPFGHSPSASQDRNPFYNQTSRPLSSNNPFLSPSPNSPQSLSPRSPRSPLTPLGIPSSLSVYSKGIEEMEWNFSRVQPPTLPGRRGSATAPRPVSSYGLENLRAWKDERGNVRKSVVVGNGFGGYLAVPVDDGGRPSSSAGERGKKRGSSYDMFR
ncbi:hypothetical protein V8E51_013494 [Hyaloscypha variabilis]